MALLQAIASVAGRVALCTIFLMSAVGNKIPKFSGTAEVMEKVGVPMPNVMLVGAIVFLVVGSLSVMVGFKARWGALLLMIFLALATYFFHAFWAVPEEQVQSQMIQFMKNLGLFGAFLFIVGNGAGAGSVDALLAKQPA